MSSRLAAFVLALLFVFPASSFAAANYPEVVFILDGSGSMWGSAGDETKIEAAKKVMAKVVPGLPGEVRTGLVVYGHRSKGDCADIETVIDPGSDDREALLAAVKAISPKGKTPMAASVREVAQALRTKENETTVILVSDGEETCDDDPCGVVKALKESGVKFVLHVVGFGVDEDQKKQLQCLAEAGGGVYYGASDADGLLEAMGEMRAEVAEKVEKAKTTKKKAVSKLGKLRIAFPGENQTIRNIKIKRLSDGKVLKTVDNPKNESTHPLLAGDYEIIAGFANPNYKPETDVGFGTYTVKGGETTEASFGVVALNVAEDIKKKSAIDGVVFTSASGTPPPIKLMVHGNDYYLWRSKPLPEGTYAFAFQYHKSPSLCVYEPEVKVEPGKTATITIDSGIRLVKPAEAGQVTGWDLVRTGTTDPVLEIRRRWDNSEPLWRVFAVPAGTYDLWVRLKGMDEPLPVGEGLVVEKGDMLEFETGL